MWLADVADIVTADQLSATVDHLVPISRGGSNRVKNTVLACRACNNARGATPWQVWERVVRRSVAERLL